VKHEEHGGHEEAFGLRVLRALVDSYASFPRRSRRRAD
jgi:hypothetical protein